MKKIERVLNVPKLVFRTWGMLFIITLSLLMITLCLDIHYPIVVENIWLIRLGSWIEQKGILKYYLGVPLFLISANIVFLTCTVRLKYNTWKEALFYNVWFVLSYITTILYAGTKNYFVIVTIVLAIITNFNTQNIHFRFTRIGKINVNQKLIAVLLRILLPLAVLGLLKAWYYSLLWIRGMQDIWCCFICFVAMQLDCYIFLISTLFFVQNIIRVCNWGFLHQKTEAELKVMKRTEYAKNGASFDLIQEIDKELERQNYAKQN